MLSVDKKSVVPLYQQIKDQVRELVDGRAWTSGMRLPSERELIAELDVSRITVRQALRDLVAEGYLTSAAGKGFFVTSRSGPQDLEALVSHTAAMRACGVEPSSRVIDCVVQEASAAVAQWLRLPVGAEVVHLVRAQLGNGLPLAMQRVWLPHHLVPGLAEVDFTHASLFEQLRERFGLQLVRAETTVSARLADPDEARELELHDPPIGLSVNQLTFDEEDRVVELSRSLHHPLRLPVRIVQAMPGQGGASTVVAQPVPARGSEEGS
ncbi:GntR family transcriptional regulator [Nonomuraea sp. NPDC049152]|uniref:GntR family transcriptional regulator n=1 Tax=Nonomuraea sp. NPDC049152 TaxID=3154350 RepID=UPI0033FF918F